MKGLQSDNTYCLMFAQDKIFVSKSLYQQILSSASKYNMAARSSLFHYNPSKRLERDEDYTGVFVYAWYCDAQTALYWA